MLYYEHSQIEIRKVINKMKEIAKKNEPQTVWLDCEQAIINSVENTFEECTPLACFFHFKQRLWRRIEELGFSTAYNQNENVRMFFKKVAEIAFVPLSDIVSVYDQLRESVYDQQIFLAYIISIIIPTTDVNESGLLLMKLVRVLLLCSRVRVKKSRKNKSVCVDGVSPVLLDECAQSFSIPISRIFKKSLNSSELPSVLRHVNITPIFKKCKRNLASNYRPISLTSITCKIMEKMIKNTMVKFLEKENLITNH
ncbi:unnamed protein product [Brachionus calyciflorus]|uniref:MULE transposase domain-containing protein n=1 Tax=Brachionus calyciflorus TaxID=104777 RepID=A0A813XUD8_9BILA|nr:unnamed protein product [Brachionus calyciflorus]